MKKLMLTAVIALFMAVGTNAQEKKPLKFDPYSVEVLSQLSATDAQKKQVLELRAAYDEKATAIKKDKSLDADARKVKLRENISERSKEYYKIITKEQRAQLLELKKKAEAASATM
jgi:Spy/CpxP family protein refolding chaperone